MCRNFDSIHALNSALCDTRGDEIVLSAVVAQCISEELKSIVRLCGVILNYGADLAAYKTTDPLFSTYPMSRRDALGVIFEIKTMRERYQGQVGISA